MGLLNPVKSSNPKLKWVYYGTTKIGKITYFMK